MFPDTYCAARLQTVAQGAPVSVFTVAREMEHGGEAMVRRVYGHLGQVRHRAEAVEYRPERHVTKFGAVATVAQWWSSRFVIPHGQRLPALAVVVSRS